MASWMPHFLKLTVEHPVAIPELFEQMVEFVLELS